MDQETPNPPDGHAPPQEPPAGATGRQRRRVPSREPTEAERFTAAQAVDQVTNEIKSRGCGLRRLGYGLLFIIGVLLFGGMGVAFYSQILLISHSTDQQEAVRAAEVMRDASKKKLDDLAPTFEFLHSKVSDSAMVAIPPTPLGINTLLLSVYFAADGQRGWAVGQNGTVLRLNPVDLTALNAAVNLKGVTMALTAAGINEQVIGQPLDTLRALEGNRDTLRAQIAQDDAEIQKRKDALPNVFSTKLDPLELFVFITKFALLIVLFFSLIF